MAKLYIFGIGGTGSRVLRSFTFLLGTGVKVAGFNEVVPIVVDADSTSGDKTDTVQLMENYQKLYQATDHTTAADPLTHTLSILWMVLCLCHSTPLQAMPNYAL